jgi:hypothetical protein
VLENYDFISLEGLIPIVNLNPGNLSLQKGLCAIGVQNKAQILDIVGMGTVVKIR